MVLGVLVGLHIVYELFQVNPNFAIDLIAADPVVVCEQRRVSSNSGGALGHPKVFINLVSKSKCFNRHVRKLKCSLALSKLYIYIIFIRCPFVGMSSHVKIVIAFVIILNNKKALKTVLYLDVVNAFSVCPDVVRHTYMFTEF